MHVNVQLSNSNNFHNYVKGIKGKKPKANAEHDKINRETFQLASWYEFSKDPTSVDGSLE